MKYYDKKRDRLIVIEDAANEKFWDNKWNVPNFKDTVLDESKNSFLPKITSRFLDSNLNKKILEGGCGKGSHVLALKNSGFSAIGIDYANKTVRNIHEFFPEIDVRLDDVRRMNFKDEYFDGYWSLGVIEHFYEGYEEILDEMKRVIKKDGYLFLTFPTISLLRRIKISLNMYKPFDQKTFKKDCFYQFILNKKEVARKFEENGFELVLSSNLDGLKGLVDELMSQKSQNKAKSIAPGNIFKLINKLASKISSPFSGHLALLVLRKK